MTIAAKTKWLTLMGHWIRLQLTRQIGIVMGGAKRHYRPVHGPVHCTGALRNNAGQSHAPTSART